MDGGRSSRLRVGFSPAIGSCLLGTPQFSFHFLSPPSPLPVGVGFYFRVPASVTEKVDLLPQVVGSFSVRAFL